MNKKIKEYWREVVLKQETIFIDDCGHVLEKHYSIFGTLKCAVPYIRGIPNGIAIYYRENETMHSIRLRSKKYGIEMFFEYE